MMLSDDEEAFDIADALRRRSEILRRVGMSEDETI